MTAIDTLYATILERRAADPSESYVAALTGKGRAKIAQKVGEEAVETALAAVGGDRALIAAESADLLFHLCVLWADCDLSPQDIYAVLELRQGRSGLAEKTSRSS